MKTFIIFYIIPSCLIGLLYLLWKYTDKQKEQELNSVLTFIHSLGNNIFSVKVPNKPAKKEPPEDNSTPFEPIESDSGHIASDLFWNLSGKGLRPAEVK